MAEILLSALFNGFFMVRVVKGPWLRNPQYLAVAIAGCMLAMLGLKAFWPGLEDDFIVGNLVGLGGCMSGMLAFDAALGLG